MRTFEAPFRTQFRATQTGTGLLKTIEGLVVPYNTTVDLGAFSESIAPDAFYRSLQDKPSIPLWLHHVDVPGAAPEDVSPYPIGLSESFDDQPTGLRISFKVNPDATSQSAAQQARAGMLGYMSIRFDSAADGNVITWNGDHPTVTRTRARLVSVSLTDNPAYPDAKVTSVRHIDQGVHSRSRRRRR